MNEDEERKRKKEIGKVASEIKQKAESKKVVSTEKQAKMVESAVKKQVEKVVSNVFKSSYEKTFGLGTRLANILWKKKK